MAFVAFLVLLGAGILAFIMTLDVRDESMPPIPSAQKYRPELKVIRDEMKELVDVTDDADTPGSDDTGGQPVTTAEKPIEGVVVDDRTGDPITKFEIGLLPVSTEEMTYLAFARWIPFDDPEGQFSIPLDQLDDIKQIAARADGYAITFETIGSEKPSADLVLRLKEGAKVIGRVLNTSREPIEGARIYPTFDPNMSTPDATTDSNGAFELTLPFVNTESDSVQALAVLHDDYVAANFQVPGRRGDREHVEIILTTGGRVAGHVLRGGRGVAGATVRAQLQSWAEGPTQPIMRNAGREFAPYREMRTATTDADGRYEIALLFPGEAAVTLMEDPPLCVATMQSMAIVEDQRTTQIDFELAEQHGAVEVAVQVRGETPTFVHADVLTGEADVELRGEAHEPYRAPCVPVGPATLVISASLNDTMYRIVRDIEVAPDTVLQQSVDLGFQGIVRGTCADMPEDKHALVLALFGTLDTGILADYDPSELMMRAATYVEPNPDGSFELTPLEQGDYTIVAAFSTENLLEQTPTDPITYFATHATVADETPVQVRLAP